MTRTTLQIPLEISLRNRAEKVAKQSGFSSIQEVVRVFLNKFASKALEIGFVDKEVELSEKAEKRYLKMINDAKKGKNIVEPKSFEELISVLS